jgi:hypothetical protein
MLRYPRHPERSEGPLQLRLRGMALGVLLGGTLFFAAIADALAKPCAPPPERRLAAPSEPSDAEVAKIRAAGNLLRTNVDIGSKRFGRAETVVEAPREFVLEQVQAYGQYKDLTGGSRFKTSRIVAKEPSFTDVYMQVTVLKGFLTIWQVMRFSPPRAVAADTQVIDGTYVKGNLSGARTILSVREVSKTVSILRMDLLIELPVPAPQEAIDEELRDAAADAVSGLRDKAQSAAKARQPSPAVPAPAEPPR